MQELTVKGIHKSLNTNGYICDVPFAARITSAMQTKPVSGAFLYGPAGTGKSYLPIVLSKMLGIEMFFYQCAPGTREDDLVLKMLPSEKTKSGIEIKKSTVFRAAEASHHKQVMLVLDEWDKTRPTADGFFLDFLQYGRLSIPGSDINANLDNMYIFFTANDERDFHEALLRRFPKIDVDPMAPSLVMSALRLTHDGHPHLSNVIKLYERAVMSGMSKPATIQEIRQLLDAISFLGDGADWNSLVYQYVTKTPENHQLLKEAENASYESIKTIAQLKEISFEGELSEESVVKSNVLMPKKTAYLTLSESIDNDKPIPNENEVYGVYDYNDENYSMMAHKNMQGETTSEDSSNVNDFEVIHDKMIRKKPYQMTDMQYNQYSSGKKMVHEVCYVDKNCKLKDLLRIPEWQAFIIRRYSKNEVVARAIKDSRDNPVTIDLRWTPDSGITLIATSNDSFTIPDFFTSAGDGNSGKFVNITEFNTDDSSARLIIDRNNCDNGILNLRKLVEHDCIQYSNKIKYSGELPHGFGGIASNSDEVIVESDAVVYKGRGFEIKLQNTEFNQTKVIRVKIDGTPKETALDSICRLGVLMGYKHNEIPIYKSVSVNTSKLSKHLKRHGWNSFGSRRGLMRKVYRGIDAYGACYMFDDFAVFGFSYNYDMNSVRRFSQMRKVVNQLAKSASTNV